MKQTHRHQIKRVVFDFQFSDETTAFGARKKIETLFHSDCLPVLESVFEAHVPSGSFYHIPRLEIDLGTLNLEHIETADLAGILSRQLVPQIKEVSSEGFLPIDAALSCRDTFIHFLNTGTWPCPTVFEDVYELERSTRDLLPSEFSEVMDELLLVLTEEVASLRLVYQFNSSFVNGIIDQLIQRMKNVFTFDSFVSARLKHVLGRVSSLREKAFFIQNLASALSHKFTPELEQEFKKTLDVILQEKDGQVEFSLGKNTWFPSQAATKDKRKTAISNRKFSSECEENVQEEVFTSYAGVVLLHPFLCRFFQNLHLLNEKNRFESLDAQEHAIHVLHFLASGMEHLEEPKTCLLKVLCGFSLAGPLKRDRTIADREKEEAQALLLAVIGHWAKLKKTSAHGFCQEFLQREGKFEIRDSEYHLMVEQRSIDILLSSLPWSYSIIRLPWMEVPLRVDWV